MSNMDQQIPMTWMDVARTLGDPSIRERMRELGFLRARVSWQRLVLFCCLKDDISISLSDLIEEIFPRRVSNDPLGVVLDDLTSSVLEVEVEQGESRGTYVPSFGVIDGVIDFETQNVTLPNRPVPIVAALSVKGGTGRTTTAIAFAIEWAKKSNKPVLLVDADVEAPGITYLYESEAGEPSFSLEDLIVYAHSDETEHFSNATDFASQRLKNQNLNGNVIVLPLRRRIDDLTSSSLRAEHLSSPENPFGLSDLLSDIAHKLGCVGVVIDVRAGLVPLGANLALDPQVKPIFVTSLSSQAVRGTLSLLRFVSSEVERAGFSMKMPLIVVNRVPINYHRSGQAAELISPITEFLQAKAAASPEHEISANEDVFSGATLVEAYSLCSLYETPDMQVSAGSWSEFLEQLKYSGFQSSFEEVAQSWLQSEVEMLDNDQSTSNISEQLSDLDRRLDKLRDFASELISAESTRDRVPKPLVIRPFDELARRFQSDLPVVVVEGAKGTGKTLAARYYIDCKNWLNLCKEMIGANDAISANIIPVTASVQASESYLKQCDQARCSTAQEYALGDPEMINSTLSRIKSKLDQDLSEEEWLDEWLTCIAFSCGYKSEAGNPGNEFIDFLRKSGKKVVAIFEGIEELYQVPRPELRKALRALLVNLPMRLRSEIGRPLGCVIFSRRDTTEIAVLQNLDHFRREYSQFALSWTEEDVLELAAWLASKSEALPGLWNKEFQKKSRREKDNALDPLWGRKLGPNDRGVVRTREAYSSKWIIAVLSDLQGRLIPRDLVRLLFNAASEKPFDAQLVDLRDRLLTPKALRDAVAPTSSSKVKETVEEIPELSSVFEKFAEHAEEVDVPIEDEDVTVLELTKEDVELLQRHGIIYGLSAPYEVPELFRRGLQLRHSGARYSVISLYNKSRKWRSRS